MTTDLDPRIRSYTRAVVGTQEPIDAAEVRSVVTLIDRRFTRVPVAVTAALIVAALIGGAAWLVRSAPDVIVDPADSPLVVVPDSGEPVSDPTGGTPLPDVEGAVPGDDGDGPLPLGHVTEMPDSPRLDFLFELCWTDPCFRDAHFMDPAGTGPGSGAFDPYAPFHIRHGFPVSGDEPLGDGFDVVVYVTPLDEAGEFDGAATGQTVRYTSDYVLRGETDACGPQYESQRGPVVCEWFVHEFPDGLPPGRHAIWAVWEAPCWAWLEFGSVPSCEDPDEVMGLFSSGFDAPFEVGSTEYSTARAEEGLVFDPPPGPDADASGAAPTGGTPLPDFATAVAGDAGEAPLPLGAVIEVPSSVRLDFLFELCWTDPCFRDAHFMDPSGSGLGAGTFGAGVPFHVRHGFPDQGRYTSY